MHFLDAFIDRCMSLFLRRIRLINLIDMPCGIMDEHGVIPVVVTAHGRLLRKGWTPLILGPMAGKTREKREEPFPCALTVAANPPLASAISSALVWLAP